MLQHYSALVASHVQAFVASLDREDEGQGLVEYALIIVLVSIVAMVALNALGTSVTKAFTDITAKLDSRP